MIPTRSMSNSPVLCLGFGRSLVIGKPIREYAERNLDEIDRLTKKLDLAVLRDQAPEKQLVNGASRPARLRGELVLSKDLVRRVDHDLDILQVHIGIHFADEPKE